MDDVMEYLYLRYLSRLQRNKEVVVDHSTDENFWGEADQGGYALDLTFRVFTLTLFSQKWRLGNDVTET